MVRNVLYGKPNPTIFCFYLFPALPQILAGKRINEPKAASSHAALAQSYPLGLMGLNINKAISTTSIRRFCRISEGVPCQGVPGGTNPIRRYTLACQS